MPLSSRGAENKAMSSAAKSVHWLRGLLDELRMPHNNPTIMFCENQSTIRLVRNLVMHERTKHIELDHHYIRERHDA